MPPCANAVVISRVRCPHSNGHSLYGKGLKDFFRVPRVLGKGDIFPVVIKALSYLSEETHLRDDNDDEGGDDDVVLADDLHNS